MPSPRPPDDPNRIAGLQTKAVPVPVDNIIPSSGAQRNQLPMVAEGIEVLTNGKGIDQKAMAADLAYNKRERYAPMKARQETAAIALASGASFRLAAQIAGCSSRQVKHYYQSADFRARVEEHRSILMSRIKGRITAEFKRRTSPTMIQKLEIMDLVRLYDRMSGEDTTTTNARALHGLEGAEKYEAIINQVFNFGSGGQSGDFPEYGTDDVQLPGSNPQIPRTVSGT
jgi:hypothetical protein